MSAHPPLTPLGSALAGALGAVFSNAVVYPLDTVKTRLQALPPSSLDAEASEQTQIEKEDPDLIFENVRQQPEAVPKALLHRLRRWQMLSLLIRILKTEGLGGAFKGFSASMINTFSTQFAYFFFHTLLRTTTLRRLSLRSASNPISLSTTSELLLGALAGALSQVFTIPVAVIATRQQLYIPPASSPKQQAPSLVETAREIIAASGLTGLWTGLKPGLVLTVNPAITYGVFERMKTLTLGRTGKAKLSLGEAFLIGVGSKTLATVVTYPYIFAKVRLQAKTVDTNIVDPAKITAPSIDESTTYAEIAGQGQGSSAQLIPTNTSEKIQASRTSPGPPVKKQPREAIPLLMAVYRERGFLGWYQGLTAQIVKAVLCQGILFVSKDQFEVYACMIMVFFSRLRARIALK